MTVVMTMTGRKMTVIMMMTGRMVTETGSLMKGLQ